MSNFLSIVFSLLVVVGLFTMLAKMFGGPSRDQSEQVRGGPTDTFTAAGPFPSRLSIDPTDAHNRFSLGSTFEP